MGVFEMMSGHPPFQSAYRMQVYQKVLKGIRKVPFPPKCQEPSLCDLILNLLQHDSTQRLPMRSGCTGNLRSCRWYGGFDWYGLEARTLVPPYRPVVKSATDLENFHARKEDGPRQIHYELSDGPDPFAGFSTAECNASAILPRTVIASRSEVSSGT